jgi:hypothetical protein
MSLLDVSFVLLTLRSLCAGKAFHAGVASAAQHRRKAAERREGDKLEGSIQVSDTQRCKLVQGLYCCTERERARRELATFQRLRIAGSAKAGPRRATSALEPSL